MKKICRKLSVLLMAALLMALTIPMVAHAGVNERVAMDAYWRIVGNTTAEDPLTRAMNGQTVPLEALTAVTADDLMTFAVANRLPIDMARCGWYTVMVDALRQQPPQDDTLVLFLSMPGTYRDSEANAQRRAIRRGLTQEEVLRLSRETGLPGGFIAWLLLEDDWQEGDWEDVDDWREGRSGWVFADHAYEKELRASYGQSAVVDDDEVERVLRQSGVRYDD